MAKISEELRHCPGSCVQLQESNHRRSILDTRGIWLGGAFSLRVWFRDFGGCKKTPQHVNKKTFHQLPSFQEGNIGFPIIIPAQIQTLGPLQLHWLEQEGLRPLCSTQTNSRCIIRVDFVPFVSDTQWCFFFFKLHFGHVCFCYWHAIDFSFSFDIHQYSETFCKAIGPIPLRLILNDASPSRFNNIGVAELCPLGEASRCEIWWWKLNLIISEKTQHRKLLQSLYSTLYAF